MALLAIRHERGIESFVDVGFAVEHGHSHIVPERFFTPAFDSSVRR